MLSPNTAAIFSLPSCCACGRGLESPTRLSPGRKQHMSQETDRSRPGLSRRAFLKGSGVTAAATALAQVPLQNQAIADDKQDAGDGVAIGPGPVQLELSVNGTKMSTKVEPRVTLLDALRNYLDVTGCKRVCDRGTCGACTVMVDGKTVYACTMLALEARGKQIRTAES